MFKINVSKDKAINLPLLIGGITACVAPPLSKFLTNQPIAADDGLSFFGCLAGLLTGNVERNRKPAVFKALDADAKISAKMNGADNG
jgi:hypothetical protein